LDAKRGCIFRSKRFKSGGGEKRICWGRRESKTNWRSSTTTPGEKRKRGQPLVLRKAKIVLLELNCERGGGCGKKSETEEKKTRAFQFGKKVGALSSGGREENTAEGHKRPSNETAGWTGGEGKKDRWGGNNGPLSLFGDFWGRECRGISSVKVGPIRGGNTSTKSNQTPQPNEKKGGGGRGGGGKQVISGKGSLGCVTLKGNYSQGRRMAGS